jgi:hypothetical protein
MQIKITVSGPDGVAHVIDLEQESEGFWLEFLTEMQNAGHGADTICRTIAERIKATVQPVLTAGPVDNAAAAGEATALARVREAVTAAFDNALSEGAKERQEMISGFLDGIAEMMDDMRTSIIDRLLPPRPTVINLPAPDAEPPAA